MTLELLIDRELLKVKLEYAQQKLFDASAELRFGNKTNEEVATEIDVAIDILNDKKKIWK